MARQIFVEETNQESEQQSTFEEGDAKGQISINIPDAGETIISAHEIEKLFHEWDANGHNNLIINKTLAERIRQYLDYQEELDPLKEELVKRIYKPYKMKADQKSATYKDFYINDEGIGKIALYSSDKEYRALEVKDLKIVLLKLKNPYAIWIPDSREFIDIKAYVAGEIGGVFYNYKDKWVIKV